MLIIYNDITITLFTCLLLVIKMWQRIFSRWSEKQKIIIIFAWMWNHEAVNRVKLRTSWVHIRFGCCEVCYLIRYVTLTYCDFSHLFRLCYTFIVAYRMAYRTKWFNLCPKQVWSFKLNSSFIFYDWMFEIFENDQTSCFWNWIWSQWLQKTGKPMLPFSFL